MYALAYPHSPRGLTVCLVVLAALAASGCGTPVIKAYGGPKRDLRNLAVVLVTSDPRGAGRLADVDGKRVSNPTRDGPYAAEIHLMPGQHKLTFDCNYRAGDYIYTADGLQIEEQFAANRIYQLRFRSRHGQSVFVEVMELGAREKWQPLLARIKGAPSHWRQQPEDSTPLQVTPQDPRQHADILYGYACYLYGIGEPALAEEIFSEALMAYRNAESTEWQQTICQADTGLSLLGLGQYPEAAGKFEAALASETESELSPRLRGLWTKLLGQILAQDPSRQDEGRELIEKGKAMLEFAGENGADPGNITVFSALGTSQEFFNKTFGFRHLGCLDKELELTKVFMPPPQPTYYQYQPQAYIPPYIPPYRPPKIRIPKMPPRAYVPPPHMPPTYIPTPPPTYVPPYTPPPVYIPPPPPPPIRSY